MSHPEILFEEKLKKINNAIEKLNKKKEELEVGDYNLNIEVDKEIEKRVDKIIKDNEKIEKEINSLSEEYIGISFDITHNYNNYIKTEIWNLMKKEVSKHPSNKKNKEENNFSINVINNNHGDSHLRNDDEIDQLLKKHNLVP